MTDKEYNDIQNRLADKINSMEYKKNNVKYNNGFKDALLVAKSILHAYKPKEGN